MNKNAIICSIYKYSDYKILMPWINSIKQTSFQGDIVIIAINIPDNMEKDLFNQGVLVVKNSDVSNMHPNVLRFKYIHDYLLNSDYQKIVLTDARDVIFQKNPFESKYLIENTYKIISSCENILFKNEEWIKNNLINTFGVDIYEANQEKEAVCAGVLAGNADSIARLCLEIYNKSASMNEVIDNNRFNENLHWSQWSNNPPDQAALNIILNSEEWIDDTAFLSANSDWNINLGVSNKANDSLLIHNPGYMDNGIVKNDKGDAFFIVHQYDRILQYYNMILSKYSE